MRAIRHFCVGLLAVMLPLGLGTGCQLLGPETRQPRPLKTLEPSGKQTEGEQQARRSSPSVEPGGEKQRQSAEGQTEWGSLVERTSARPSDKQTREGVRQISSSVSGPELNPARLEGPVPLPPAPGGQPVPLPGTFPEVVAATPADPHLRAVPTVKGEMLNLNPLEDPFEKALALASELEATRADRDRLIQRLQELEQALAERNRLLGLARQYVEEASAEVKRSRQEQLAWSKTLAKSQLQVEQQDQENLETLKSLIALLERMLGEEGKKVPATSGSLSNR